MSAIQPATAASTILVIKPQPKMITIQMTEPEFEKLKQIIDRHERNKRKTLERYHDKKKEQPPKPAKTVSFHVVNS